VRPRQIHSPVYLVLSFLIGLVGANLLPTRVSAHPYPNSVISVDVGERQLALHIRIPAPDLLLVLTGDAHRNAGTYLALNQHTLMTYIEAHLAARDNKGQKLPQQIGTVTVQDASEPDVGVYVAFVFDVSVPIPAGVDGRNLALAYDAVIHQIPNHHALVEITKDFRNGQVGQSPPTALGVISYNFATKSVPPLSLTIEPGNLWIGFKALIDLGLHHVAGGLDHILFLVTLLVVAPLRVVDDGWSLFQGYGYTVRRFLTISLAFTIGHSVALALGSFRLLSLNPQYVEVLIAISILIAAMHGFRPLFASREWLVAGGFGLVHGLAFSGSLTGLNLAPKDNAIAVLGFNIGVEAAQLLVMALTLPLLFFSRYPAFHKARQAAMVVVSILAILWIAQRAFDLPLPQFMMV
jgi:HupE / UreJ protein